MRHETIKTENTCAEVVDDVVSKFYQMNYQT